MPGPHAAALFALLVAACSAAQDAAAPTNGDSTCIPGAPAHLSARLRGAIDADLDWPDGALSCEGGPRPDGSGLRLTVAGPLAPGGRTLRFVFGIDTRTPGADRDLPTNLTLIVEGAGLLFATRGADKCTVDRLRQAPTTADGARRRIEVRGFCTGPATSTDGEARVLVERFDFATTFTTGEPH
ncbi:MAG: hypothetical protein RLZZ393_297 [Pseudomonadota bacterium]